MLKHPHNSHSNPIDPREKWNIDLFTIAGGEADVQPSLLLAYLTTPLPLCQALFSLFLKLCISKKRAAATARIGARSIPARPQRR